METMLLFIRENALSFIMAAFILGVFAGGWLMAIMALSGKASLNEEKLLAENELFKAQRIIQQKEVIIFKLKEDITELKKQKPLDAKTGFPFNEAREAAIRSVKMGEANCTIRKADAL